MNEEQKEIYERLHGYDYCQHLCKEIMEQLRDKSSRDLSIVGELLHSIRDNLERI